MLEGVGEEGEVGWDRLERTCEKGEVRKMQGW